MQKQYKELIIIARQKMVEKQTRLAKITKGMTLIEIYNPYNFSLRFVEETFDKIMEMERSEDVIINPLARIIDYDEYDELSEGEKERYILKLSNLYLELKRRIIKTA